VDGLFAAAGSGTSVGLNVGTGKTLAVGGTLTMSALTASTALALNASKQAVSVTNTGTGNNVLSASPTLTGTIDAAAQTLSGNLTLNGGTANGVLYLNGSKVATSGSALVYDGNGLGVGVASPAVGASSTKSVDASGPLLAGGAINAHQTNKGVFQYSGNETTIRSYGATASSGQIVFNIGGGGGSADVEGMRLTASGILGLGVTPSVWGSNRKAIQFGALGCVFSDNNVTSEIGANVYISTAPAYTYITSNFATRYAQVNGQHQWHTAASGTAGNTISFTQAMTLDADGKLLINKTSSRNNFYNATASANLQLEGSAAARRIGVVGNDAGGTLILAYTSSYQGNTIVSNGNVLGVITFQGNDGSEFVEAATISAEVNGTPGANDMPGALVFSTTADGGTSATERARITSGGYFKASNDGTYVEASQCHELRTTEDARAAIITATNASYTSDITQIRATRNTTNNSFYALTYYNAGATAYKFRVADSGDVTNTNNSYGAISDAKMKTDIVDAGSQWADIKAVRFRKFKMKDDPQQITQLGVVAQELEQTSPGLVDEHADRDAEGNDLGTTTKSVKTSILLMKAAVALQEAMARIEQLEAKFAALESK
jgi:hypothetical protein